MNGNWFYRDGDETKGPFEATKIIALQREGLIDERTYIYDDQTEEWGLLSDKSSLLPAVPISPATPPVVAQEADDPDIPPGPKDYFVEGFVIPLLLAVFRQPVSQALIDAGFTARIFGRPLTFFLTFFGIIIIAAVYAAFRSRPEWWVTSVIVITCGISVLLTIAN